MYALTDRLDKLLQEDRRVPHAVRADLRKCLDALGRWRDALCHGPWFGFSGDGAGLLPRYHTEGSRIVRFPPLANVRKLAGRRARIRNASPRAASPSPVAAATASTAAVLPR